MNLQRTLAAVTGAALCMGLIAAAPAPEYSPDTHDQVTLILERTTAGASDFELSVSAARGRGQETFIGMVGLVGAGEALEVHPITMAYGSGEPVGEAHVAGSHVGCSNAGCGVVNQLAVLSATARYDSANGGPDLDRMIVVVESETDVAVDLEGSGWQLRRLASGFDTVRHEDVDGAVSVYAAGSGYEVFKSAAFDSPADGSIAMADMPCAGVLGTAFGPSVGSVTLSGGRQAVEGTCVAESSVPLGAVADGSTAWRLDGAAAGSNGQFETRLAVIPTPTVPSCSITEWIGCVTE